MARQPETVDGLTLDVSGLPFAAEPGSSDPQVGDIFRSHSGQPAYWWVIGHVQGECNDTMLYIVFNMRGQIVGVQKAATYYLARRQKVGHMPIPPLQPTWLI